MFAAEENVSQNTAVEKKIFFNVRFQWEEIFFKNLNFLFVSNEKFWEIYDEKRKKVEEKNFHTGKKTVKGYRLYFPHWLYILLLL